MQRFALSVLVCAVLAGCNAAPEQPSTAAPAASAPAATAAAPAPAAAPSSDASAMPGMTAEQHAAMNAQGGDAGAMKHDGTDAMHEGASGDAAMTSGAQAGWYSAGTFRACGSTAAMKVDKASEIDQKIKAGGMSAGDPVYVKLEGMPMGKGDYMVTRVVQVGSSTPVRDCPMTGTTTQSGR